MKCGHVPASLMATFFEAAKHGCCGDMSCVVEKGLDLVEDTANKAYKKGEDIVKKQVKTGKKKVNKHWQKVRRYVGSWF